MAFAPSFGGVYKHHNATHERAFDVCAANASPAAATYLAFP